MPSDRLPSPDQRWALFLDVDGTLIELADHPDEVEVPPTTTDLLAELARVLDGAVALVSGRSLGRLDELFAPLRLPAAGLHGLERRSESGQLQTPRERDARLSGLEHALRDFCERAPGTLLENKTHSLALHYRMAPEQSDAARRLVHELVAEIDDRDFHVQQGKQVLEIKPQTGRKDLAIERFLQEEPFAGRTPVFVGDDLTDEHGFEAVNRRNGHSIRVGGRGETAATFRIDSVGELLSWLRDVVETLNRSIATTCR